MCADPTTIRRGAQTRTVLTILDESRGNLFFLSVVPSALLVFPPDSLLAPCALLIFCGGDVCGYGKKMAACRLG